jgi:hypothetical protein
LPQRPARGRCPSADRDRRRTWCGLQDAVRELSKAARQFQATVWVMQGERDCGSDGKRLFDHLEVDTHRKAFHDAQKRVMDLANAELAGRG